MEWLANRLVGERIRGDNLAAFSNALRYLYHTRRVSWESQSVHILIRFLRDFPTDANRDRYKQAASVLFAHPDAPSAVLEHVFNILKHKISADVFANLALHPRAAPEFVRRVVEECAPPFYQPSIERFGGKKEDSMRSLFTPATAENCPTKLPDAFTIPLYLSDALPQDCAELFRSAPLELAAAALENYGDKIAPLLSAEDLVPLPSSNSRHLRLLALQYVRKVRGAEKLQVPGKGRCLVSFN